MLVDRIFETVEKQAGNSGASTDGKKPEFEIPLWLTNRQLFVTAALAASGGAFEVQLQAPKPKDGGACWYSLLYDLICPFDRQRRELTTLLRCFADEAKPPAQQAAFHRKVWIAHLHYDGREQSRLEGGACLAKCSKVFDDDEQVGTLAKQSLVEGMPHH